MKNIMVFLVTLIMFSSCAYQNYVMVKPYTITSKAPYHYTYQGLEYKTTEYMYQDSIGQVGTFFDSDTLYHIGDVIH